MGSLAGAIDTLDLVFGGKEVGEYSGVRVIGPQSVPLAGTFSNFRVNPPVYFTPSKPQIQEQGAVFSRVNGEITDIVVLFPSGNFAENGVFAGTYLYTCTDGTRAVITTETTGTIRSYAFAFTTASEGTFTADETGTFSNFTLGAAGTGDGLPVATGAPQTLDGRTIRFGPGELRRKFQRSSASGTTELGTFTDPGTDDSGNYSYRRDSDTNATLLLNNLTGMFPGTSEMYALTFTSGTSGRQSWAAYSQFDGEGWPEAVGEGPFTFVQ